MLIDITQVVMMGVYGFALFGLIMTLKSLIDFFEWANDLIAAKRWYEIHQIEETLR